MPISRQRIRRPAKIAVISSGLFGSISGVAAANVYATGVFTIPLMKKLGYRARFAGAVEAAASTGGMLMPPVMGAGAFVMSEITGISYLQDRDCRDVGSDPLLYQPCCQSALCGAQKHLLGLKDEDLLSYTQILKDSYLLIPMLALIVLLVKGYSPFLSANAAIALTFLISFVKKETMMTPKKIWQTLHLSGANMVNDRLGLRRSRHGGQHRHPYRTCSGDRDGDHKLVGRTITAGIAVNYGHVACAGNGLALHAGPISSPLQSAARRCLR